MAKSVRVTSASPRIGGDEIDLGRPLGAVLVADIDLPWRPVARRSARAGAAARSTRRLPSVPWMIVPSGSVPFVRADISIVAVTSSGMVDDGEHVVGDVGR